MRILIFLLCVFMASPVLAGGGSAEKLREQSWPHQGMFGKWDKEGLQRGFQVYREVCSSCHSLNLLSYRHLEGIGFSKGKIKALASDYTVMDGPNDEGEMFERSAKPSDGFVAPYPNEQAARYANGGALPPDLSLIVKNRPGHEDYLYSLLTGFTEPPADFHLDENMYYNRYYPGHQIAMAPPLSEELISYEDGTAATLENMTRDLTQFLAWASDPHMEVRKQRGFKVLIFLSFLTILFYVLKGRIWKQYYKKK